MSSEENRELIKGLLICAGFVAVGLALHFLEGPSFASWTAIIVFGTLGGLGFAAAVYKRFRSPPPMSAQADDEPVVFLRDGREYKVALSDREIVVTNKTTGAEQRVEWQDLTEVYALAIDHFPVGSVSFVLHAGATMIEVPTDAEGGGELLTSLQSRLEGFDNTAVVEIMGMLHGFKQLWRKNPAP